MFQPDCSTWPTDRINASGLLRVGGIPDRRNSSLMPTWGSRGLLRAHFDRCCTMHECLLFKVCYSKSAERNPVWMIALNATENHEASHFERLSHWIKLQFTRHEAWALKAARRVPLFALFAFGTLWPWFFLPLIPIGILSVVLLEKTGIFGAIVNMVLGIGALAIIAPWFFRWYFICAGLMFGRTKMAQSKDDDVSDRLERLIGTKAASKST